MKVSKPIFIVGIGRSGSTAFHRTFSKHPNVAWLSGLCNRYPNRPSINRLLMKTIDYPIIGSLLQKKQLFNCWECYNFWEYHCKGFSNPCRDLLPEDEPIRTKEKVNSLLLKKKNGRDITGHSLHSQEFSGKSLWML